MKIESIPIQSIVPGEERFRITYGDPPERLLGSVKKIGVLNPPWVRPVRGDREQFEIVLGYSRILAAREAGVASVSCRVIDGDIREKDLLLANIFDNISQRELNPIDQALALKKSLSYFEKELIVSEIMPAIGLAASPQAMQRLIRLLELPESILLAVAESRIPPSNAFNLLRLTREEQLALFDLFQKLRLGVNFQKEFMENFYECSRRDGIPIQTILENEDFSRIIQNEKIPESRRAAMIRLELRRLRYPRLSQKEQEFERYLKSLGLPPEINLLPPPYFENDIYRLNVRFKKPEKLLCMIEKLRDALSSKETDSWFHNTESD